MSAGFVAKRHLLMLLVSALALLATTVTAEKKPSLGCDKVWKNNVSSKNDPGKCMTDLGKIGDLAGYLVMPALCILFLVFLGFIFPFFFCCRQCCNLCGGKHRQPGYCCTCKPEEWIQKTEAEKDAAYSPGQRMCAKIGILVTLLVGGASIIIMNTGAAKCIMGIDDTLGTFDGKVLGNLSGLVTDIDTILKDSLSPTGLAGNVSNTTSEPITKAVNNLRNQTRTAQKTIKDMSQLTELVAGLISAMPLILMVPLAIFALCNVRRCGPACCTCCYYFTVLLFSLLGLLTFIFAIFFTLLCGEVDLYKAREPGILTLWAEPMCEEQLEKMNVSKMTQTFDESLVKFSGQTCTELAKVCSSSTAFNAATPELVFVCNLTPSNAKASCVNLSQANKVMTNSAAKTGINPCTGGTVACNMTGCSESCDNPSAKTAMKAGVVALALVDKFQRVMNLVLPLLRCRYWFVVFMRTFDHCHAVEEGLWMIGASFLIGMFVLFAGICLAFRGQKVFFTPKTGSFNNFEMAQVRTAVSPKGDEPTPRHHGLCAAYGLERPGDGGSTMEM
jgi:hypothetical protein